MLYVWRLRGRSYGLACWHDTALAEWHGWTMSDGRQRGVWADFIKACLSIRSTGLFLFICLFIRLVVSYTMLLIVTPTLTQPQRNSDFTRCSHTWQTQPYMLRLPLRSCANSVHVFVLILKANPRLPEKRSPCCHIYTAHHRIIWQTWSCVLWLCSHLDRVSQPLTGLICF